MSDGPLILGINRTQDASICLMRGSELQWAIQKERLTRQKHHWGRLGDLADIYVPRLPQLRQPIDVLVECYSSDAEFKNLAAYDREISETLTLAPGCKRAHISHHLAHVYSAFPPSPFERAAVMIIDGQGSEVAALTEPWRGAACVPGNWCEVASFYRADRGKVACIDKQVWNRDDQQLVGLGMFYFLLTQTLFPGHGNEGKVMGLAPYGDPAALNLPPLLVEGWQVTIPTLWRQALRQHQRFRYAGDAPERFADSAALAAAGQRAFEDALVKVAHWLHGQTGLEDLCFAGGTALNCSANERLLRETPFRRIFVPPATSDAGTALGCAIYGLTELADRPCDFRWNHDYLGPVPAPGAIESALADQPDLVIERIEHPADLCGRTADLIAGGKVVGLYQGGSESGPRALGHRSILGDPRQGDMRDRINSTVKLREWFRPLAPVVLLEHAATYFDIDRPSPFMQFASPVRAEALSVVPAITHVDATARLQTVGPEDDAFLRRLLTAFYECTGVPVLLNTSFNGKDEPIVETPQEALQTFRATPMDALAMPPFLIRKRTV